ALRLAAELATAFGTPVFRLRALLDLARLSGAPDAPLRAALAETVRALDFTGDALPEVRDARLLLDCTRRQDLSTATT
ncbi:MAG TPA: hypothetical protein VFQ39_02190, partial [Longimicrobium sp.]|nr:hypothetical protein [Longimicrobium sp.]